MHTCTRMLVCGWAERCHSVPSPLVGEGQGEGYNKHCVCFTSEAAASWVCARVQALCSVLRCRPSAWPSRTRGEGTVWRTPSQLTQCACGTLPEMCACPSASAGTKELEGDLAHLARVNAERNVSPADRGSAW